MEEGFEEWLKSHSGQLAWQCGKHGWAYSYALTFASLAWKAGREYERNAPVTVYDWEVAPGWAKWAARDKDGRAFWYAGEPHIEGEHWEYGGVQAQAIPDAILKPRVKWDDSLEIDMEGEY